MDEEILSKLGAAAVKQYLNARQTFTAYEAALKHGLPWAENLRPALHKHEQANAQLHVGNVDLKSFERLRQTETSIVTGEGALYAYEARTGVRLKRETIKIEIETANDYPTPAFEAVVVGLDGRMTRMRAIRPSDYVKRGYPYANLVQFMMNNCYLYDE